MKVHVKDARLFFARNIFVPSKPRTAAADAKLKYQLECAIDPGSENHRLLKEALMTEANAKTGGKGQDKLKQIAAAGNLWVIREGDLRLDKNDEVRAEYKGKLVVSAKNEIRPLIIGGGPDGRAPVTLEDGKFYSGCRVNAIIDVQIGDKPKWQAYAYLLGVQFCGDGERIGAVGAAADDFEPIPSAEGAKAADSGQGAASLF
jgi:hypothetical protein